MKLNTKQRKYLKALSHHIKPRINIGKDGLTEGVILSINEHIEKKELIKIKFSQNKENKTDISLLICDKVKCKQVYIIGNNLIVYKKSSNPKYCQIELP
jgi:RNA-binding protein